MSTTHVQSLPNVRGRMSYTEFGEGKRRREHLENGTDRIAAQMGDAASREDFIVYCEGQKHRHPNAVNEGYEVRISWATDELDPSRPDDIQRGMEYAYTLCHELAPDSMCWVTMHVDGEGGCVHAHATIANHDARSGQVINKEGTSLYAPRVQAVNDRLSRENGFQVLGADKEMSTWAQRCDTFAYDSFDRRLGDKVAYARDRSDTVDEFKRNLELEGVTLKETVKTDKKTGEVTAGWSYKAVDEWGPKRRSRKRRASNLADDLTKEGVEAYFEEKQRQAEAQKEDAPAPVPVATVAAEPQTDSPAEPSFDVYSVEESDVAQMAGDLQRAHIDRCRESGEPFMGERYEQLMEAERHPEEQLAKLQAEVDVARREFHASKEARDALNHPCPNLLAGAWVFAKAGRDAKDPVSRMMADMTAMMLRMLLQQAMEEQPDAMADFLGEEDYAVAQRLYNGLTGSLENGDDQVTEDLRQLLEDYPEDRILAFVEGDAALQSGDSVAARLQQTLDADDEKVCSIGVLYGKWRNDTTFASEEAGLWNDEGLGEWLGEYVTPGKDLLLALDGEDCSFDDGDTSLLQDTSAQATQVAQKLLILNPDNKVSTATPEDADAAL